MRLLYTLVIHCYHLFIHLFAFAGNPKARQWVKGRAKQHIPAMASNQKSIWFHCASLGEFEQARPLLERIKKEHPRLRIILTFFSPSGFLPRKNYEHADEVYYLPLDTPAKVRPFLKSINPSLAIFTKYEFWYNYLAELHRQSIPLIMFSGIYRPSQPFFKWYGGWFRKHLLYFDHHFVQNESSKKWLKRIDVEKVTVSGDSRIDRVLKVVEAPYTGNTFQFKKPGPTVIIGSSWPTEEQYIHRFRKKFSAFNLIIAPHEVNDAHLTKLFSLFENSHRYSELTQTNQPLENPLIIDSVGQLAYLYRFADIAIIGGGFEKGIHNILEAAAYGKPVLFGPKHHRFQEANDLLDRGAAKTFQNYNEFELILKQLLNDAPLRQKTGSRAGKYCLQQAGSTEIAYAYLSRRWLTKVS
jgi:3-deoxy-D-manno-octulosonic-acid transferase